MGMSYHVLAIKPADEKYMKMKAAWDACEAAGIPVPEEVERFFGGEKPDESGMTVSLGSQYGKLHESVEKWTDDMREGFQVDITKLPPGVRFVRFYCSY